MTQEKPNIALVVLDTLRKDHFDDHFDWLPGVSFDNAWSTSHWTVPAHASLFTGKYASEVGIHAQNQQFDCQEKVLAELLQEEGYTTRAFSANPNISRRFGADRGFEKFGGSWRLKRVEGDIFNWNEFILETQDKGPRRFLEAIYRCVVDDCDTWESIKQGGRMKLRDMSQTSLYKDDGVSTIIDQVGSIDFGKGEFFFINLMEAHCPYEPPRETPNSDLDGMVASIDEPQKSDPKDIREAYDISVKYLSEKYEILFEELREDFDVIITLSDHGELLGEEGCWEHMWGLYPQLTHVPLSVHGANLDGTKDPVSVLDVFATVLDLAGIENCRRGMSLLGGIEESRDLLTEYHGVPNHNYEAVTYKTGGEHPYLKKEMKGIIRGDCYSHMTFHDGFLHHNGGVDKPQYAIDSLVERLDKVDVEDREVGDDVLSHLEDLGYA